MTPSNGLRTLWSNSEMNRRVWGTKVVIQVELVLTAAPET